MSASINCFSFAIGLSRTTCPCNTSNQPGDYDLSESGIFLDEVEGMELDLIKGSANCTAGNIWDMMNQSRENAIDIFRTDLLNYIGQYTERKRNYFNGTIGEITHNSNLSFNQTYAGLTWKTAIVRSGVMRLKRIGLIFTTSSNFDIVLYTNTQAAPLATFNVNSVANTITWFSLPAVMELPLYNDTNQNPQYWLVYEKALSPVPRNNKINCGCGELGKVNVWGSDRYTNLSRPTAMTNWLEWMLVAGTKGNDLTKKEINWNHGKEMNGLVIDAELVCNAGDVICKDELDFVNDPLTKVMAYTIRYKAGELLAKKMLSSPNLNRFTMLDREAMYGNRNHYKKEYDNRIKYLGDEFAASQRLNLLSDCLSCKNESGMTVGRIKITG